MKSKICVLLFVVCAAVTLAASDWPQWRGPNRDNQSTESGLYRTWPAGGPKVLWKTPVAEGYAGVAIKAGRAYINDYDPAKKEHVTRCLSMADGKEMWRWSYPVDIRPNHGITRTVPSIGERLVFSLDPKCRFHRDGMIVRTVDRQHLWRAQTPQGFPRRVIVDVHRRARADRISATDDAALCERYGIPVRIVRGSERALKVTDSADFARIDALFATDE